MIAVDAEHDAVGLHEVVERRALLEELRVAAHVERLARVPAHRRRDLGGRAHRDGGLGDHHQLSRHVLADDLRHLEHVSKVRGSVLVRRGADRDEHDLGSRDRGRNVRREMEPALLLVALDERVETGLVDGQDVLLQAVDLRLVDVRTGHVVSGLGEACADDQADVARPDDGNLHACSNSLKLRSRNSLPKRLCGRNRCPRRHLTA